MRFAVGTPYIDAKGYCRLPFKLDEGRIYKLESSVFKAILEPGLDHIPGEKVEGLGGRILTRVTKLLEEAGLATSDYSFEREWAMAYAVCTWVSTRVIDAKDIPANDGRERIRRGQSQVVLDQTPPSAVCSGRSRLTRDLGRICGLQVEHLGGDFRPLGGAPPAASNHGWVCFIFGKDGYKVPADTTAADVHISYARRSLNRLPSDLVLPRSAPALELFIAERYSYQVLDGLGSYKNSNLYNPSAIRYDDWRSMQTHYLANMRKRLRANESAL